MIHQKPFYLNLVLSILTLCSLAATPSLSFACGFIEQFGRKLLLQKGCTDVVGPFRAKAEAAEARRIETFNSSSTKINEHNKIRRLLISELDRVQRVDAAMKIKNESCRANETKVELDACWSAIFDLQRVLATTRIALSDLKYREEFTLYSQRLPLEAKETQRAIDLNLSMISEVEKKIEVEINTLISARKSMYAAQTLADLKKQDRAISDQAFCQTAPPLANNSFRQLRLKYRLGVLNEDLYLIRQSRKDAEATTVFVNEAQVACSSKIEIVPDLKSFLVESEIYEADSKGLRVLKSFCEKHKAKLTLELRDGCKAGILNEFFLYSIHQASTAQAGVQRLSR